MAEYDLGTARGRIDIDASGAVKGVGEANAAMGTLDKKSAQTTETLGRTGLVLVGSAVAITAGFGIAINYAANFEERISAISAVSGVAGEQLDRVREKALQLGADTKYSAEEAAMAMEELVKAGIPIEGVLNGAADAVVALAAAGEVDLTEAATIAANAMNAFGLSAEQMPRIADLIAGAANASAIDVSQFGLSLQQAGAVANVVGLSFDDLAVAIAMMGNAGIKGSDAGTSLKTFLTNLVPTTEKQITLMKELGLMTEEGGNAFFDASGKIKSMADISETLKNALSGMTQEQKLATLQTLYGTDAIRAAAVIADGGAASFNNLSDQMGKIKAVDVAATRMDNLKGSLEQLRGSMETLLIVVGKPLADGVRVLVDGLTQLLNTLGRLDPKVWAMVTDLVKVTAVVLGSLGTFLLLVYAIEKVKKAMAALKVTMMGHPLILFVAAVIALSYALYQLYQNNETFRKAVQAVFSWLRDNVPPIIAAIVAGLQSFAGWISDNIIPLLISLAGWLQDNILPVLVSFAELVVAVAERLVQAWQVIWPIIEAVLAAIQSGVSAFVSVVSILWERFGHNIVAIAETAFGIVKTIVETVLGVIRGIIDIVTGIISGDWSKAWEGIKEVFGAIWDGIKQIPAIAMNAIMALIATALDALAALWEVGWALLPKLLEGAWGIIVAAVETLWTMVLGAFDLGIDSIVSFFIALPGRIIDVIGSLAKFLIPKGIELLKGLVTGLINYLPQVLRFLALLPVRILGLLAMAHVWLLQTGIKLLTGLLQGIVSFLPTLLQFFIDLPGNILNLAATVDQWLLEAGISLLTGLLDGILEMAPKVWQFFLDLPANIFNLIATINEWLREFGIKLLTGLVNGIVQGALAVWDWFTRLPGAIQGLLVTAGSWLWDVGRSVITGLWSALCSMSSWLWQQIPAVAGWIIGGFGNAATVLWQVGVDLIVGLWRALESMAGWLWDKVEGLVGGIVDAFKSPLDMFSPSKVMMEIGRNVGLGLINGILATRNQAIAAAAKVGDSVADLNNWNLSGVNAAFQGAVSLTSGNLVGTGGGGGDSFTFSFPNVTSANDADVLRATLQDPIILNRVVYAVKAGRR